MTQISQVNRTTEYVPNAVAGAVVAPARLYVSESANHLLLAGQTATRHGRKFHLASRRYGEVEKHVDDLAVGEKT